MMTLPANVTVFRPHRNNADHWRQYRIFIDGREAFRLADNTAQTIYVPQGRITIEARIDWGRSPALTLDTWSGDDIFIEIANNWVTDDTAHPTLNSLYSQAVGGPTYLNIRRLWTVWQNGSAYLAPDGPGDMVSLPSDAAACDVTSNHA